MKRILFLVAIMVTSIVSAFAFDAEELIEEMKKDGYEYNSNLEKWVKKNGSIVYTMEIGIEEPQAGKSINEFDFDHPISIEQTIMIFDKSGDIAFYLEDESPKKYFPDFFNHYYRKPQTLFYRTDDGTITFQQTFIRNDIK